jgi:hypothetical protein
MHRSDRAFAGRSVSSSSPIVATVQSSQSSVRYDPTGGRTGSSGGWCLFREAEMRAVFVMQVNNTTPIIANRKKSVTPGTLGAAVLWPFTKRSPGMVGSCLSAASIENSEARHLPQRSPKPAIAEPGTLTPSGALIGSLGMKCLERRKETTSYRIGKLGWSWRRIEEVTGVRRETASTYLKAAGVTVYLTGWGRRTPAKPAIQVTPTLSQNRP